MNFSFHLGCWGVGCGTDTRRTVKIVRYRRGKVIIKTLFNRNRINLLKTTRNRNTLNIFLRGNYFYLKKVISNVGTTILGYGNEFRNRLYRRTVKCKNLKYNRWCSSSSSLCNIKRSYRKVVKKFNGTRRRTLKIVCR